MTIPHMMNCAHQPDGWCLACVASLASSLDAAEKEINLLKNFHTHCDEVVEALTVMRDNARTATEKNMAEQALAALRPLPVDGARHPIGTDDELEAVARLAGWNNRRYMTPKDYSTWCERMREFVRLASLRSRPEQEPRVWDAGNIGEAPEGKYMMRRRVYVGTPESWNRYELFDLDIVKLALSKTLELPTYDAAFGPIPQPHTA